VKIQIPKADEAVTRETFSFQVDKAKLKAAQQRDGHYLLRSNLTAEDPAVLWTRYVQLTQIESVFRSLKSELGIRPVYHQLEHRADAHVLITFLAYCLQVTLKNRTLIQAPGLTPAAVLEKLATIQMVEVWIPTLDGSLAGVTAPHSAGERCSGHAGSSPHQFAVPTAATDQSVQPLRSLIHNPLRHSCGEDLRVTLTDSERLSRRSPPNCERSANGRDVGAFRKASGYESSEPPIDRA
jgi:hypothetical protein